MTPLPLTLCLYTSTKGHYGVFDRYQQTITSLFNQVPSTVWAGRFAHIKDSQTKKAGEPASSDMGQWLSDRNIFPVTRVADWAHGENHQSEYLTDMTGLTQFVTTPYLFHLEDDWVFRAYQHDLVYYLAKAVSLLEANPHITQVRIPRWFNERQRIEGLKAKHNIDAKTRDGEDSSYFLSNDWSNNPFVVRTRDMQLALLLMERNPQSFPLHSEHGLGRAMRYLSRSETPLAVFDTAHVRCGHIGTLPNEEDPLDKPLFST